MQKAQVKKKGAGTPRRNLPAEERRRELLQAAMDLFSEKGMAITVQELADRVNVTQPLVHRYFPTKADLIAAIRDTLHNAHWDPEWRQLLLDRQRPLDERLATFYRLYLPHIYQDRWLRGFLYAALDDSRFAEAYLDHVFNDLQLLMIGEIRHMFGYPDLGVIGATEREFELIWGMHSTAVFMGIRRHVYHSRVSDVATTVGDQIRALLAIAPAVLEELMPQRQS